jgi:16S rRNA (guanine966-N2)-methyltransferase
MRIITGRFNRRKLLTNPGQVTRPITDRIKESLFNFLGDRVIDAKIADIFSGTGTLGLEALSRGAASVVFYEKDRSAFDLLHKNVKTLKVNDEVFCWSTDVTRTSFRPKDQEARLPYDIVFFDPPYKFVNSIRPGHMLYRSLIRLARTDISAEGALLLFRTPKYSEFEVPPCWELEQTHNYSTMDIHWYRNISKSEEPADSDLKETENDKPCDEIPDIDQVSEHADNGSQDA